LDRESFLLVIVLPAICGVASGMFLSGWQLYLGLFLSMLLPAIVVGAPVAGSGQGAFGFMLRPVVAASAGAFLGALGYRFLKKRRTP
jgi:hypothetical protein